MITEVEQYKAWHTHGLRNRNLAYRAAFESYLLEKDYTIVYKGYYGMAECYTIGEVFNVYTDPYRGKLLYWLSYITTEIGADEYNIELSEDKVVFAELIEKIINTPKKQRKSLN